MQLQNKRSEHTDGQGDENMSKNTGKRLANIQEMSDRELRHYRRALRLRKECRRKAAMVFLTVFATVCIVLICVISYGALRSSASSGFKYYKQITVKEGESLWEIAGEYADGDYYKDRNSYIAEVLRINHLDTDGRLVTGQSLIIPYYSAEFRY